MKYVSVLYQVFSPDHKVIRKSSKNLPTEEFPPLVGLGSFRDLSHKGWVAGGLSIVSIFFLEP